MGKSQNPFPWKGRFFRRVFVRLGLVISLGMLLVGAFAWQIMQRWMRDYTSEQLRSSAHLARLAVRHDWPFNGASALSRDCARIKEETGLRLTIIALDGRVLADSDADPLTMANHASRPEVSAALRGETGVDERISASVGQSFVYVAMPLIADGEPVAVVRVAAPAEDILRRERAMRQMIVAGLSVAVPLAILFAWILSRALASPVQRVSEWAQQIATGDLVTRLEVRGGDEITQVADSLERMRTHLASRIREAHQQRKNLEITVSNLEEGVIAVDRAGIVLLANPAARRLLGVSNSMVGGPLAEQIPQKPLARLWGEASSLPDEETRRELELELDGAGRTVEVSVLNVSEPGTPIARVVCLRDITAIARSAAMKTDFVANASHELRTPVASIRAAVDTLKEEDLDQATRRRFLSMIDRNVDRLQNLTEDLMHLNKVESVFVELTGTEFSPRDVFASLASMFRDALDQKSGNLSYYADVETVFTDERWLELVLKNLVDNAVKFIAPGGCVELRCRAQEDRVVFEVEDNGCGIPPEDIDRVFERFYQVDKSRSPRQGGTGLGLAIVKHAVHAMRGEITISSKVGKGTVVRFSIPARQFAARVAGAAQGPPPAVAAR